MARYDSCYILIEFSRVYGHPTQKMSSSARNVNEKRKRNWIFVQEDNSFGWVVFFPTAKRTRPSLGFNAERFTNVGRRVIIFLLFVCSGCRRWKREWSENAEWEDDYYDGATASFRRTAVATVTTTKPWTTRSTNSSTTKDTTGQASVARLLRVKRSPLSAHS